VTKARVDRDHSVRERDFPPAAPSNLPRECLRQSTRPVRSCRRFTFPRSRSRAQTRKTHRDAKRNALAIEKIIRHVAISRCFLPPLSLSLSLSLSLARSCAALSEAARTIFTCRRLAIELAASREISPISFFALASVTAGKTDVVVVLVVAVEFLQPALRGRRASALNTNEVPSVSS